MRTYKKEAFRNGALYSSRSRMLTPNGQARILANCNGKAPPANVEQSSSTVSALSTIFLSTKPPLPHGVLGEIPDWRDALGDADLLRTTDRLSNVSLFLS
ncbi:hypothetical protein SH467x_000605 [Pirellulaceae bacterium SH467]